jgi:hypothetical protein
MYSARENSSQDIIIEREKLRKTKDERVNVSCPSSVVVEREADHHRR